MQLDCGEAGKHSQRVPHHDLGLGSVRVGGAGRMLEVDRPCHSVYD